MSKSPARKLIDTSFAWLKDDKYYVATDLMSRVDSAVLFTVSYNLYANFPNFSPLKLKRYLELRNLPNPNGFEIVDSKNSCYEDIESTVFVRALTKERWKNRKFNQVTINNLVLDNASKEEKINSLKNLKVKCGCKISNFIGICRPPEYIRRIFRDERKHNNVPGPFVDTFLCKHAFLAIDWLRTFYRTTDFGIGLSSHVYTVSTNVIQDVLKYKLKLPNYKLNSLYRGLLFRMYAPVKDLIWNG
jgi:hypothetical protein